jgi:hypothetical protein
MCWCTLFSTQSIQSCSSHALPDPLPSRSRLERISSTCSQGCQMVSFQTENPNLCKLWRVQQRKILVKFTSIGSIFRSFGIFYGHLVYFPPFWYIFSPVLVYFPPFWYISLRFGTFFPFWYVAPRKIWQPCLLVAAQVPGDGGVHLGERTREKLAQLPERRA